MTCIRDILDEEGLEREFESIRKVFRTLKKEELPLRMEWGTKQAFEEQIPRINISREAVEALNNIVAKHLEDIQKEAEKIAIKRGSHVITGEDVRQAIKRKGFK